MPYTDLSYDLLRPLSSGWVGKLERAVEHRKKWRELAAECSLFYSKSAAAMWDPLYTRKIWTGVKAPKFRISINKAFEMVAVFGPNLFWDVPHRTVEPKKAVEIPQELFQGDPEAEAAYQSLMQRQQYEQAEDKVVAYLMQTYLNYSPREQPGGGLAAHSKMCVLDGLIKGRGLAFVRPYTFPSSGRTLTGCFRELPENLLIDPDFNSLEDAKWIGLRHVDPHWAVERRFKLEANSLKGKSSLESAWSYGESKGDPDNAMHRVAGQTNDLVVWYEIWSKTGPGARLTGMNMAIKEHLEEVVGDYAYLAIAPAVPYPLNASTEFLRKANDEQVKQAFAWPIPTWADDRWPCSVLDFYPDPDCAWPIPPLAPGLGELKFLNFLVPWLANRIWTSSRDFWAVAGPHYEHYRKYLLEGEDQTIIPTPTMVEDVKKVIQVLTQPETRADVWRIVELVSAFFDKRVGLTPTLYGQNENNTQNRTAEETASKYRAANVRLEDMQKTVASFESQLAQIEAFVARWFVTGESIEPLLGPVGRYLWERHIMSTDVERVVRQMQYDIAAASIRRPDRDRDIANFTQIMQYFAPTAAEHGAATGNYVPYNALMRKWAEFHDADLSEAEIPPPEQNEQAAQLQQQQMQLEMAKLEAEVQGKQLDMQAKQMDLQAQQAKIQLDLGAKRQQMLFDVEESKNDLGAQQASNVLELMHDRDKFRQEMAQQIAMGQVKLEIAKKQAAAKPKPSNGSAKPKAKAR